jgi:hypothetical protein
MREPRRPLTQSPAAVATLASAKEWAQDGAGKTATANLDEGVQDVVTMSASAAGGMVGGAVSLSGTVTPDHTGHVVHLQLLGTDGYWHNVATGVVANGSTYSFTYTFGETGDIQLRAQICGGPENVGGAAPAVTVVVSGVLPVASLPLAS